ncbi:hypothetical protein MAP00_004929 [Monascus purpureus]|nr:hypothetical protein MAP00_004929 [Monascus purpureus]
MAYIGLLLLEKKKSISTKTQKQRLLLLNFHPNKPGLQTYSIPKTITMAGLLGNNNPNDQNQGQGGLLGGLGNTLGQTTQGLGQGVGGTVQGVGAGLGQAVDGVGSGMSKTTQGLGSTVGGVTDSAGNLVGNTVQGVTGGPSQQQQRTMPSQGTVQGATQGAVNGMQPRAF